MVSPKETDTSIFWAPRTAFRNRYSPPAGAFRWAKALLALRPYSANPFRFVTFRLTTAESHGHKYGHPFKPRLWVEILPPRRGERKLPGGALFANPWRRHHNNPALEGRKDWSSCSNLE